MVQRQGVKKGAVSINNCIVYTQLIYIYRPPLLLLLPAPALAPAPTPTPALAPALALPLLPALLPPALTAAGFALAQYANPIRLLQAQAPYSKATTVYAPTAQGKQWSQLAVGLAAIGPNKRRDQGYIGRIIETEFGVELVGSKRYTTYQALGKEYQVYSKKGIQQVSRPRNTYARY